MMHVVPPGSLLRERIMLAGMHKVKMLAGRDPFGYSERVPKRDSLAQYAAQLARLGGKARAKKLTAEQRREIARKAARARWAKPKKG
jgi:hypothetical protein